MPTKYSTSNGTLSDSAAGSEPKFPIYFCEGCGFQPAPFSMKRADGQLSYCGWVDGSAVCVGRAKKDSPAAAASSAPWE